LFLTPHDFDSGIPLRLMGTAGGVLLLLGLGTPLATAVQVLIEGWLAFSGMAPPEDAQTFGAVYSPQT
jgi:hypothetical protein